MLVILTKTMTEKINVFDMMNKRKIMGPKEKYIIYEDNEKEPNNILLLI